jgi:hypothetical protein
VVASSGGAAATYPELLGTYLATGAEENSRGVWQHSTILTTMYLHYTINTHYKWEGWMITPQLNDTFGYISNQADRACPSGLTGGWEFQLPSGWQEDASMTVKCEGAGPTTSPTGPGPTTTTTRAPGPGGVSPTMVVIKQQTMPGADVFILGGVSPDLPIDIVHYDWPGGKDGWDSVNDWNVVSCLSPSSRPVPPAPGRPAAGLGPGAGAGPGRAPVRPQ